jgi:pyruvate dehydrogenase (quinone)
VPIKIVVFDNGKLGFVELEQKGEGIVAGVHGSEEPGFRQGRRSRGTVGPDGHDAADLETAIQEWLAEPGPPC